MSSTRERLTLVVGAALLVWTAWRTTETAIRVIGRVPDRVDPSVAFHQRFEPLRGVLAAGTSIGYASGRPENDVNFQLRYTMATYVLTPLVVHNSDRYRFVLADFDDDNALTAYVAAHGGRIVQHADLGLGLIERSGEGR